jgi:predicted short-subunit dehydrogenase-like oxidoreductase (DUF2520 family)
MKKAAIIGAGRLGTTLGYSLSKQGFHIIAASCKSLSSARESVDIIGEGTPVTDNKKAVKNAETVILSVPDDSIKDVVKELSSLDLDKKFIFHCSGILSSRILQPLRKSGAVTASLHPVQSFPKKSRNPGLFKHVYFGIEGDDEALRLAKIMVKKLGGRPFILDPDNKPLYHTACTIASNYSTVLMGLSESLLGKAGVSRKLRSEILLPLVKGTLDNIEQNSVSGSLTGPVSRGDLDTLTSHLKCLKKYPSLLKIYKDLAAKALEIAKKEKHLPPNKIRKIRALLE